MSGVTSASIVGVNALRAVLVRVDRARQREAELVHEPDGRSPISTRASAARYEAPCQPCPSVLGVLGAELEAIRAVDGERIDVEPLQGLEQRLAGTPEERHPLLDLGRLRRPLEQEHVRERVSRSEHGTCSSSPWLASSSPSALISAIAFFRYRSKISSVGHGAHDRSSQVRRLADLLLDLGDPLERLQVGEGARPAKHLGGAQGQQELLGALEPAHPQRTGADPREDVRVRACAREQPVLAREAERLVVVGLEQQPGVVDLEDVDLGKMPVQRLRIGDRVRRSKGCGT